MRHSHEALKLFPKIFLYTLTTMLFIVIITHGLIYLLAPRMQLAVSTPDGVVVSIRQEQFVTEDETGTLAQNVNDLYSNLLSTIEHLKREKSAVRDMERSKADFLRAASHELKTPVTALNATLENMILGVGKYRDYAVYLPVCKDLAEQLSGMIREILETSRLHLTGEPPRRIDLSELLAELCEPYQLIAAAQQITFSLDLPEQFPAVLPVGPFSKAVSNILANAVAYTETGKTVSVYMNENHLIVENECVSIPDNEIRRLFEPFYRPGFSRSRESGGNGLGLYIVDTLLTAMKLPYSFESMKISKGMRFTIDIRKEFHQGGRRQWTRLHGTQFYI